MKHFYLFNGRSATAQAGRCASIFCLIFAMLMTISVGEMWGAAKQRYIYVGISNNYQNYKDGSKFGLNVWGGTSGGVKSLTWIQDNFSHDGRNYTIYRAYVYDDNNKAQFKGNDSWYDPAGGYSCTLNGTTNNAVFFSHNDDGWQGQFQRNYQVTSTASLSATSTSMAIGSTSTLTPSLSSNATYNEIKSTSYSVTTNPNSGGSLSGNVFSATKAGTYVVTATVTYNAKDFSGITKTATATQTITVYSSITLNKNGGSTDGSATVTLNATSLSSVSAPTRSNYHVEGYYMEEGCTNKVATSAGALQASTTYTNSSKQWTSTANQTLYAKWEGDLYSITYKDEGGSAFSGTHGTGYPTTHRYGTATALVNPTKSGYSFEGWYYDSSCNTSAGSSVGATAKTANFTLYAKWEELSGGSVTLIAGTGGQVSTDNSSWGANALIEDITTNQSVNIYARANSGYSFSTWTKTTGTGSVGTNSASGTYNAIAFSAEEVRASFTENTTTLTPTVSYDHGSSNYTASATNSGTIGVATTTTISCSAPNAAHYTFAGWTLTNLTVTNGDAASDRSITVKVTTPGSAISAVANYNEVLTTSWKISGDAPAATAGSPFKGWGASGTAMTKKSGHSTEEIYYCNITVSTVASTDDHFPFQVYDGTNHRGYNNYWITKENNSTKVYTNNATNMKFRPYVTGTYEFKVDNTGTDPVLTVTWPVFNQVRISAASPSDASNVGNFDLSAPSSNVRSVTKSLQANTTYTFKIMYDSEWYGFDSGTFTRSSSTSSNSRTLSKSGGNMTLTTDYAGDYTFKFNQSTKALSIDFPAAYKVTYGKGSVNGSESNCSAIDLDNSNAAVTSNSTWVKSGHDVKFTAPAAKSGYTYDGWFDNDSGTGTAITTNANCTISVTSALTRYACYHENKTSITITTDGHGTITTPSPNGSPYSLGVATTQAINASPSTGYHWNTWTTSGTAALGTSATTQSNTAKGNGTNGGTGTITATFTPKNYTISLNQNGATTESDPTSLTATYDAKANGASDVFTLTNPERTGYTFRGWNTEADTSGTIIVTWAKYYEWETSYVDATGHWVHDGDVEVFAMWKANQYTVNLSASGETGYSAAGGKSSVTATYDSSMPDMGTAPTAANGYKFMGYFTGRNGSGTQYYNADGTSAANWNIAEETTLYAYFKKAAITSFTHDATLAKDETVYLVVNPTIVPADAEGVLGICWTLLYDNDNPVDGSHWSVAPYTESGAKPYQVKYTLSNLENGTYKVQAVLKVNGSSFDACGNTGTELSTETTNFSIIGSTTVTVQYQDNSTGQRLQANGSVVVPAASSESVTAPSIVGYTFHHWVLGDGVTCESGTVGDENTQGTATITVSSDYDGYLTAKYNKKQMIYFNNTLGWDTVYVYFYNTGNYWGDTQGTGSKTGDYDNAYTGKWGGMIKMGSSDIYYFDLAANSVSTSLTNVVFTSKPQNGATYFYDDNHVIKRNDYSAALSMYVPLTGIEPDPKNGEYTAYYHYHGYWMNYPESTGYTLYIFNTNAANGVSHDEIKHIPFTFTANKAMPLSVTTDLEAGHTYGVKIKRADNSWYGNAGTMTNGHSGDEGQPVWEFKRDVANDCGLKTSGAGDYTFTLSFGLDVDGTNYNYHVGVHFPESTGDFRVQYKDNDHTNWRTSSVIPKGTEADTVSYYVRKEQTPYIRVQKCTATWDDKEQETTVTWDNENSGNNIISSLPSAITADGVYNFIFKKSNGALVLDKVEPYSGNYYIRVDGAGSSNWDNFRAADHLMTYSEYADKKENFTHSFTTWRKVNDREHLPNVKFVVANDYSVCISDTITQDGVADAYVDANGYLNRDANIRYMYNYKTNAASRAYIDGAQEDDSEFLMLIPSNNTSLYDAATAGTAYTQVKFKDNGNWIYEANVWAVPGTMYQLKSSFGKPADNEKPDENGVIVQYFKGAESGSGAYVTLVGGDDASRLNIRLVYDFKYNRLVTAYVPSSTISSDKAIHADIMFIREHQGDMTQITFTDNAKITDIENVYCALKFNKWTLNNRSKEEGHAALSPSLSRYERDLFYVSFPYDVKVSDIIGFGTYGTHWIIEYYDGAARAEKGFWADSEPFWKFVTPSMKNTFTLKAGTGYIVALDLDELYYTDNTHHSAVWDNTDVVELLFPGNVSSISSGTVTYNMPQHTCTINRNTPGGDRTKKDSHWNILGVPTYHNLDDGAGVTISGQTTWEAQYPKFIYQWNKQDNSLTAVSASGFDYKAMHAYMVQYAGNVTFSTSSSPAPSPVIARELYLDAPQEIEFRVELLQDGAVADQTFVSMSNDEQVSAHFVFGEDMSKEFNKDKANIYTFIGTEQAAGNTLPMTEQTTLVPVGVKIAANDDYTFSIPEGTEGVGVTLIDKERGTRTNLSAVDYTVSLEAGTYDERFMLEFSPIHNAPTGTEQIQGDDGQSTNTARKVLIDGLLYIVRDNIIYDARGARVE